MPQLKSAKKALRVSARRRIVNDRWRKKMRESVQAVQAAIAAGNQKDAVKNYIQAQSIIDRTARRHIIHPNKAARKKSRLLKAIAKIK